MRTGTGEMPCTRARWDFARQYRHDYSNFSGKDSPAEGRRVPDELVCVAKGGPPTGQTPLGTELKSGLEHKIGRLGHENLVNLCFASGGVGVTIAGAFAGSSQVTEAVAAVSGLRQRSRQSQDFGDIPQQ